MAQHPEPELASTLKRFRLALGLTQEELAEQAGISARTVSDAERGLRSVLHAETARRIGDALRLERDKREEFLAIARGRAVSFSEATAVSPRGVPVAPTPLLGREVELGSIAAMLQHPDIRLLTLTGAGGIGKTRLALEVAHLMASHFPDGVYFVALGEERDATLVAAELAKALGVVEKSRDLRQLLIGRLEGKHALVVLDTFEHVMAAAPLVYALVLGCPTVRFLVTSRSALRLRGEQEFAVPPLELPRPGNDLDAQDILNWPATALFWERARAVRHDLHLDRDMAELVIEICRKLGGLALAIELAAARAKHLPVAAIRDQLDQRLKLLVGGPVDLPPRQRTIRDTVAWSYDLLGASEQMLFRRLSVFVGGWGLDAVEGVCGSPDDVSDALGGISTLVDHSLVVPDRQAATPRFDMLDVVREYAAARLVETAEAEEIARRHSLYYLGFAEEAEQHLVRAGHEEWFGLLHIERANLRRGMAWALDRGETVLALRYTVALWRYWRQLGDFAEGRRWSDAALALGGEAPAALRGKALWATAALAFRQADSSRMSALATEALELAQRSEDRMDLRNALTIQAMVAMCEGRYLDALEPYRRGVEVCRQLGLTWQLGTSYLNLGTALLHAGFRDEAVTNLEDGLQVFRQLGDDIFAGRVTNVLAHAALGRREFGLAERLGREALTIARHQGEREGTADGLETLAAVAAATGTSKRSATLAGAAAALRATIAYQPSAFESAITEPCLAVAQHNVGPEQWQRWWQAGYSLTLDEASALALR